MKRLRRFQSVTLALCALAACSSRNEQLSSPGIDSPAEQATTAAVAPAAPHEDAPVAVSGGQAAATPPRSSAEPMPSDAGFRQSTPPMMAEAKPAQDAAVEPQAEATPVRCSDVTGVASSSPGSTYPGGRWKVPEASYGTVVEQNVQIKMSDGVVLVGDVSYPADRQTRQRTAAKFPVLLTQNPYGALAFGADYGELFVTHGYIFASIDVRGTERSAGTHDMFSPREAEDGAELVAWAAKLEGSDGRVGLQGCSQLGINQLETATQLGPDSPVKAMIPACASGDFYRDTAFDNGIPTIVGNLLADPDATEGGDRAYYREYWRTRDRLARAPAIAAANIPTLLWSGWHEPGSLGSLELYVALQNLSAGRPVDAQITADVQVSGRFQVILGDWAHAGGLDKGIELQWFDTWIKGIDTGLATDTKTPLHLAELGGTKRWINSRCYPLVESYSALFLARDGQLEMSAPNEAGQDMLEWSASAADTVEYVSEPFAEGALLAGPIAAQLRVSSSNTNAQLFVELLDLAPDGQRTRFTQGSMLGSLRRADSDKSWSDQARLPKRPYLTLDEEQALTANEPTLLEVPLWPTLWSVEPMHRIVVRISTQANSNDCADPLGVPIGCYPSKPMLDSLQRGSYALHRGGELGSLISLPLVKRGAFASATSAVSATASTMTSPLPIDW